MWKSRWYEGHREASVMVPSTVQDALEAILRHPEAAPIIHRDTRRFLLRRFPYGIHYRVIDGGVVVVACFHAKRSPRIWRSRR
jgi:plasmid stabilization system protein ParE